MTTVQPQAEAQQAVHIVIVDDSTANLKLYAKLAAGVEPNVVVHSFNDPRKALEWLGGNAADLVITDYKMPSMHGAEFSRHIRQVSTCPDVPVVVVTAYADRDYRIEALEAGASDFLRNPVDYLEFQTRARNLLRLGRHQRLMRDHACTLERDLQESEKSRDRLLRDSEARLERAQEIAQVGSWESDIAAGEAVWSKQLYRMRGLPLDFRPTLANLATHFHPADIQLILDWSADLAAGRQRDPVEVRIRRPDGKERVNLIEGRPIVDPDGVIRHLVGTAQDVTERRQIERTLAQSQKMDALGQLTGGMAHDFNNMLGVIIGNLDLVKPLLRANAVAADLVAEARDGAVRCADLIRRLLAFARRQSLRPEQTDVNVLVSDVSRMLGRTLGEHIALTLELDAPLWPVKVDVSQLEAALVNLATNARDAMPKGGQISLATRNTTLDAFYTARHPDASAGDYVLIEVCDTGAGIPPEIITRIFDPFFTTKAPGKGTGLGLSMAFGFVKQSGGHLSVYSEPGLGTTFRLYLPRSDDGEVAAASAPSSDVIVGGDETILVVEDNTQLRRTAERQLTELGYKVREADSALPALAILSGGETVDLLFTDIVMPGTMDGLDLAYEAKRLRQGLRVLLTSGFPGGRAANQRMADSPFHLLGKPYSFIQLAQAVRMVLDKVDNGTELAPPGHGTNPMGIVVDG
ncbi:MAG: response regulator [Rhodopila sp.]|nr:response regulator [Rhodopila sp.]